MKKITTLALAAMLAFSPAVANDVIKLSEPNMNRTTLSVMQAFKNRKSTREFSKKDLSLADLSDLLWAANGVTRADGKRTAPSAMDRRDVDIYVTRADGTYLYNPDQNTLTSVTATDLRPAVAGRQTSVADAPVALILVSDLDKFGGDAARNEKWGAVDAGTVSQNISLFCAAAGLVTMPRGSMDADAIKKALKLRPNQTVLLNHPVGYAK